MTKRLSFDKLPWQAFKCTKAQIHLNVVLKCGQSFRWTDKDGIWTGVLQGRVWQLVQDDEQLIRYRSLSNASQHEKSEESTLKDYFQLNVDLPAMYKEWAEKDPVFEKIAVQFRGVRILRQDPVENTFSFICSSNNNIQRISGMVENLCTKYGEVVACVDDQDYFAFPTIEKLAQKGVEENLRKLGFGYRAGYIAKAAVQLQEKGGKDYLLDLRINQNYEEARRALLQVCGIGPKVADCILLMSLDKPNALPVDTHMFQIASKKYLPHLRGYKSVTEKIYVEIGDHFRSLYGDYAGWAHSVLFSADLKHLQNEPKEEKKKARKRKSSS